VAGEGKRRKMDWKAKFKNISRGCGDKIEEAIEVFQLKVIDVESGAAGHGESEEIGIIRIDCDCKTWRIT
jgi:hypothetical protein